MNIVQQHENFQHSGEDAIPKNMKQGRSESTKAVFPTEPIGCK